MELFGKDLENETAVVAEIGVNHEGDVDKALELMTLAAGCGADAAKTQSYTPWRYVNRGDAERHARIERFALDVPAHEQLASHARSLGISWFSTPLSEDWVRRLDPHVPAFKIASGDLTFEPVVRAAAATGKPVVVSTGCATIDEVDRAVGWVRDEIAPVPLSERLVLLQCVSAYPTPIEQANVSAMHLLRDRYGLLVGYSNHVMGIDAVLAATALGAALVEVHFTDDKAGRDVRDHALSCDPDDLAELVRRVSAIRASLGSGRKVLQPAEAPARDAIRKGVIARRDLAAGTALEAADLAFARPATELPAALAERLVGQVLLSPVEEGHIIPRAAVTGFTGGGG